MAQQGRTAEQTIAWIAESQHGVVTRKQLLDASLSVEEVRSRMDRGALLPVYRGVYRVGHRAPSVEAAYLAAVLACGQGSVLAGRAAGRFFGLLKGPWPSPRVITPTERTIRGIKTRRVRAFDRRDATMFRGVPITSVARTLVDLAAGLTIEELARAAHEAAVRYRTTPAQNEAVLQRCPNSHGRRNLFEVIRGGVPVALSELERRFNRFLRRNGFDLPDTNKPAGGHRVDCRWPKHRLTVELDSFRYHNSRHSWEQDRKRERDARRRGDEFRRFTYYDVFEDQTYIYGELGRLLPRSVELGSNPG